MESIQFDNKVLEENSKELILWSRNFTVNALWYFDFDIQIVIYDKILKIEKSICKYYTSKTVPIKSEEIFKEVKNLIKTLRASKQSSFEKNIVIQSRKVEFKGE